jgi:hypothetical protein
MSSSKKVVIPVESSLFLEVPGLSATARNNWITILAGMMQQNDLSRHFHAFGKRWSVTLLIEMMRLYKLK